MSAETPHSKTPVMGTGLSGLVGSRIVDLLGDRYSFQNLDRTEGIDILNQEQIENIVANSAAKTMLHLAAFTDLNTAQKEAGDTSGIVYQVNVEGTRTIAAACARHGVHLIHLSTGYVFDGEKKRAVHRNRPHQSGRLVLRDKAESRGSCHRTHLRSHYSAHQFPLPPRRVSQS